MAFITINGTVASFAEYQDVLDRDQRLFDLNESLQDENVIEPLLIRSTERILTKIRTTDWWASFFDGSEVTDVNPNLILAKKNDFSDLCIYTAMAEYILPMIADFSTEDNNEYRKMGYYAQKSDNLFIELIKDGSWYDFDADGNIETAEKKPGTINLKRVR